MGTAVQDLVWVAGLLDFCPAVEVLGMRVDADRLVVSGAAVPVVTLDVHAASHADADRLARALRLVEDADLTRVTEYDGGRFVWRTWRGWAAEGSQDAAVWVSVTAADTVAEWDVA